jgi:hypothetical protein
MGTWSADYLSRSGRGQLARVFCYLEMQVLSLLLVLAVLATFLLALASSGPNVRGGPPWGIIAANGAFFVGLVSLACVGVIRRWRPLIRLGLYFGWAGAAASTAWFAGWL